MFHRNPSDLGGAEIRSKIGRISFDAQINHQTQGQTMPSRREKIEAMLADSPEDVELRYMLAMEYASEGNVEESISQLTALTKHEPPYVPAFFMAAQRLSEQGQIAEARTFLREGIEVARAQGNSHAAGEMSEFLRSLSSYGE